MTDDAPPPPPQPEPGGGVAGAADQPAPPGEQQGGADVVVQDVNEAVLGPQAAGQSADIQPVPLPDIERMREWRATYVEKIRLRIGLSLIAVLAAVVVLPQVLLLTTDIAVADLETITTPALSGVIGLVGSAVGYWFGKN